MKTLSRVVALAITATALVATATPAHAVGETTATSTTAYVGDSCVDQPINYTIALPADAQSYYVEIQALYPNGAEGLATYIDSSKGMPLSGTTTLQICGGGVEPYGTWTLQPTLKSWRDAAGKPYYDILGTPSTFDVVGQATTSASLKAKTKGKKVTAKVKLTAETGGTTSPVTGQPVAIQKKAGKKWKTIKTVTTSSTGTAKVKFKARKKTTIRAHFAGAGEVVVGAPGPAIPAATSKTVKVG